MCGGQAQPGFRARCIRPQPSAGHRPSEGHAGTSRAAMRLRGTNPKMSYKTRQPCGKTNMTRLYGRAPRGKRLLGTAPFGCWKTTPFIAGLRHGRIVAPMVLDGPINGRAFTAWHPGSRKATRSSLIISAATRWRGARGALENQRRITRPLQLNRMQTLHPPQRIRTPCGKWL